MDSIPSRGKAGEPGSPDAKFEFMRKFKKNQRSARSRELRIWKRSQHRRTSRSNFKLLRSLQHGLSPAEIKLKLKVSRCARKSGAFKHPVSLVEKSAFTVDDGKLAQRGPECIDPLKRVFFNTRIRTHIGTYNTRTLTAKWRRHELVSHCVRKGIEVLAIQEHRIVFVSEDPIKKEVYGNDWVFLYTSADAKGVGGIGFLVSSRVYKFVNSIKSISSRVLQLNIRDHDKIASCFYSVYSPTSCAEIEVVEKFYSDLSGSVTALSLSTLVFIMGDFNAMLVAKKSVLFSSNKLENQNSSLLSDFIETHDLVAVNTIFRKHNMVSFYGPKKRKALLDYILVRKKWCKSVSNCDVKLVAAVASDHNLVRADVKWVLKNNKKGGRKVYKDLKFLKNENCAKAVTTFVKDQYNLNKTEDVKENYKLFSKLAMEGVDEFVPVKEPVVRGKPWEDEEIKRLRQELEAAKLRYLHCRSEDNKVSASQCAKKLSEVYTSNECKFYDKLSDELMELSGDHKVAEVWRKIDLITGRKARSRHTIDADSEEDRVRIWVEHFRKLLSPSVISLEEKIVHKSVLPDVKLKYNVDPFSMNELKAAVASVSVGKASGVDGMINEILKLNDLHPVLLDILNSAYSSKTVPLEWLVSVLIPVFKKGVSSDPNNYRGIALMCVCAKLYNRLLLERLRSVLDKYLRYNQNGFRQFRSTAQHVLAVRRIFECINMTQNSKCVAIFVDFCKAFDSISWAQMEAILYAYQVPTELVQAIMSVYDGAKAGLRDENGVVLDENTFDLSVGVLQGDTLAPYLFIIVMDFVLRSSMIDKCGLLISKKTGTVRRGTPAVYLTDLDFADDIVLFASTIANAQKLLSSLEKVAATVGLRINASKTEYILVGEWGLRRVKQIKVCAGPLKRVEDYKYLGSWILNSKEDFQIRKIAAWKAIVKLHRVWRSAGIDREVKIKMFQATVESVLLYNATTWTMTATLEKSLDGAYTKLLRYALNISWREHKTNKELYGNLPRVSVRLRERRLNFAGHCWRSYQTANQPVHQLLFWSVPEGTTKRGNFSSYVKVLLADYFGEKIKKKEYGQSVLDVKSAMENRDSWRRHVKKICA